MNKFRKIGLLYFRFFHSLSAAIWLVFESFRPLYTSVKTRAFRKIHFAPEKNILNFRPCSFFPNPVKVLLNIIIIHNIHFSKCLFFAARPNKIWLKFVFFFFTDPEYQKTLIIPRPGACPVNIPSTSSNIANQWPFTSLNGQVLVVCRVSSVWTNREKH